MASEVKRVLEQGTVTVSDEYELRPRGRAPVADNWMFRMWKAQAELNQQLAELDKDDSFKVRWMDCRKMEDAPLVVCECGVAITGGLHSDWCPLKESDG